MAKKKLVLLVSNRMDTNKKEDRNEGGLIRMPAATRNNMNLKGSVELSTAAKNALRLDIFNAFSADIKEVKSKIASGELTEDEARRVAFVTTAVYNKLTGGDKRIKNIWVSDSAENIVIGADPEFLLFNDDGVVRANNILPKEGLLGSDGAMAEVRPDPTKTASGLANNIKRIFADQHITEKISHLKWMASCYHKDNVRDYPVGGHIHIGNPPQVSKMNVTDRRKFFNSINKVLDELLSIPMVRLDGLEDGTNRRTKCTMGLAHGDHRGYGYYGEWRACSVNGEEHFEHRTLSGLWLLHPSIAKAVLGTAKVIVDEMFMMAKEQDFGREYLFPSEFNNSHIWRKSFDKWNEVPIVNDMGCTTSSKDMIEIIDKSTVSFVTKTYLKKWYDKLKSMSSYNKGSKYVEALYEILKLSASDFKKLDKQIQPNWLAGKKFIVDI
jgi:hypothetical protein